VITAVIAGDEETFLIGSREIAGDSELDVFSERSPLGAAIIGLKVGEKTHLHRAERPGDPRRGHRRRDLGRPVAAPDVRRPLRDARGPSSVPGSAVHAASARASTDATDSVDLDLGVVTGATQHLDDGLAVLWPPRLDGQAQLDLGDLQARAVPRVQHLDDVRVRLGEEPGDPCELAGRSGRPTLMVR
jgi:hypothetical protein